MNLESVLDSALPIIKKWFFTFLLIVPGWIMVEQFWVALSKNIMFAVNYPYPFFISPLFFVVNTVTLIIHEAGHTIFGLFNWRFLTILGGSLMPWLIFFAITFSAWLKRQVYLTQFGLFWLSYSWFSAAAYCMDAYYQNLPLIGNLPKSAHDYTNMLSMLNILDKYETIAWIMFGIGVAIMILSFVAPLLKRKEVEYIDLGKALKKSGL